MNGIFRFENGDVIDAPTSVVDGHPADTVHWSNGAVFWLDMAKWHGGRRVVYNEVPRTTSAPPAKEKP